jgi:glycosyltransferase involved in cell wall biosynthesis
LNQGLGSFLDRSAGREDFNFPASRKLLQIHDIDLVHGHNLHGNYFDLRILPELSRKIPLVLTLHDAWLMSGHCAHSFDCTRWQIGCGHCPDLSIYPPITRDSTAFNWQRKQQIFAQSKLYITTPSDWLMRRAQASILAPAIQDTRIIPNGVNLDIFRPSGDRSKVRYRLGLSSSSPIISFAANRIRNNVFKDYKTFRAAIECLAADWSGDSLIFLALGEEGAEERIGSMRLIFIPFSQTLSELAQYLQITDIYVHAARADTFPNSVIEALACGTPVVGTAIGGIPEQIEDNRTGFLVSPGDPRNMADRIKLLLRDVDLRRKMGVAAAGTARRRFDLRQQAATYLSWYESILKVHRAGIAFR